MRFTILLISIFAVCLIANAELTTNPAGGYTIIQSVVLPGTPEESFDVMTGEISAWWDHSFSEKPHSLRIEPWPGGKFIEEFDDKGNGALHATVIYAQRGKMLRYDGPLGLSGHAINSVVTYEYTAQGDSTEVKVTAQLSGQIDAEWAGKVDGVWHHFLVEALKPYVEKNRK